MVVGGRMRRFEKWVAIVDALGLGAHAVVCAQKTLQSGLGVPAALLIGVINAAGGGLLRDVLARESQADRQNDRARAVPQKRSSFQLTEFSLPSLKNIRCCPCPPANQFLWLWASTANVPWNSAQGLSGTLGWT